MGVGDEIAGGISSQAGGFKMLHVMEIPGPTMLTSGKAIQSPIVRKASSSEKGLASALRFVEMRTKATSVNHDSSTGPRSPDMASSTHCLAFSCSGASVFTE